MAPSTILIGLSTREAIADALYRCVQGIDTNDLTMFKSSVIDLNKFKLDMNGAEIQGEEIIMEAVFNFVGPMDTTHTISNIRIDVEDDAADTASMTAYAVARHHRQGEGMDPTTPHFTSGGIYTLDLIKDSNDGAWKVANWAVKFVWCDGDASMMAREGFSL